MYASMRCVVLEVHVCLFVVVCDRVRVCSGRVMRCLWSDRGRVYYV